MLQDLTGSTGARRTFNTACAASAQAIGHGFRAVANGESEVALVGGTDSIAGQILTVGFCLLGVLSKEQDPGKASRPFDKNRDGFVVGEGSAFLVLESLERATQRNVPVYAQICGYGESENAYRITDLPPDGRGAKQAISTAVGKHMLDVAVVSAHGTSTTQNDAVESDVIASCFPHRPKVIALKSATGHPIAASGALQLALSALCVRERILPPILNLNETDCASLDYVTQLQPMVGNYLLSNSFGFGGTNAALLLGHPCTLTA
jgi:3-oxoacyl-[acyl-carrier-protein] synthase II